MKISSLLLFNVCLLSVIGCSKPETKAQGTYDVSILWRASPTEGVILDGTYRVEGDQQLASDPTKEFELSDFSDQWIPSAYALNKEIEAEVNGVLVTLGNITGTTENGVKFPLERLLTFYEPSNQPRIEIYLNIQERKVTRNLCPK